ncbi:hypothetical protein O1611_g3444 [Lasiodiplodia mahajangana]|uniref:Uncharacterized protein n=1 Tax=Lasiodiplodia mahajangana TaxID=1108764 RepID=A0ACC2JRX9_9PEZI|nr:hypothetical protein O1611_g3444 [Lasiodiplodia mahajangana]
MLGDINQFPHHVKLGGFGYVGNDGKPIVTNSLLQGDSHQSTTRTSAMNHHRMISARLVNDIGTGILNGIVPVWASEIAEYSARGTFIAMEFTLNIFGVLVAYWLGFGLSSIDNAQSAFRWRFQVAFRLAPLLFVLFLCFSFPEGPRWLYEVADIHGNVKIEETGEGTSYFQMFFGLKSGHCHTGRRIRLCIWLQILQTWTGMAGITIYGPTAFGIAGFSVQKTLWISGSKNIFYTFSTIICVFIVDRIRRRWTLWWGSGAQAVDKFLLSGVVRSMWISQEPFQWYLSLGGLNARAARSSDTANEKLDSPQDLKLFAHTVGLLCLANILRRKQHPAQSGQFVQYRMFVSGTAATFGTIYLYLFLKPEYIVPFLGFGAALKYWAYLSAFVAYKMHNLGRGEYYSFGVSNAVVGTLLWIAWGNRAIATI